MGERAVRVRRRRRGWRHLAAAAAASLLLVFGFGQVAEAQARTDYLIRLLSTSDAFRVRAQAAISLGRVEADARIVAALGEALGDEHPAVRTAAAASLERLSDPSALTALRSHQRDRDSSARRAIRRAISALERVARSRPRTADPDNGGGGDARFYVGVGVPAAKNGANVDRATLQAARAFLAQQVSQLDEVEVAPERESNAQARRKLQRSRMTGYYLDSSVVSVEQTSSGTRVVVSVIVGTYPGRDMRAILQGAATVPGAAGPGATRAALEGALRGAIRRLNQAMEASANR